MNNETTISPSVLISSCVCQKPRILKKFCESLSGLDLSGLTVDFLFVDDNQDTESSQILKGFTHAGARSVMMKFGPTREIQYFTNENSHYWDNTLVLRVANMKNEIFEFAKKVNYNYVFLIDSDLLIDPSLIKHLIAQQKPVISEIFWTAWQPNTMPYPNVWQYDKYFMANPALPQHEYAQAEFEFIEKLKIPGVYEVGGLGACTLISTNALRKGLSFSPIRNVSFWGEDRWFCVRAAAIGVELFVDTHFPAKHLYRESDVID